MDVNLDGLLAEELIRDRGHELSAEGLRRATLAATGSEERADEAFAKRYLEETR